MSERGRARPMEERIEGDDRGNRQIEGKGKTEKRHWKGDKMEEGEKNS